MLVLPVVRAVVAVVAVSGIETGSPSHRSEVTTLAGNKLLLGLPGRQGVVGGGDRGRLPDLSGRPPPAAQCSRCDADTYISTPERQGPFWVFTSIKETIRTVPHRVVYTMHMIASYSSS